MSFLVLVLLRRHHLRASERQAHFGPGHSGLSVKPKPVFLSSLWSFLPPPLPECAAATSSLHASLPYVDMARPADNAALEQFDPYSHVRRRPFGRN